MVGSVSLPMAGIVQRWVDPLLVLCLQAGILGLGR